MISEAYSSYRLPQWAGRTALLVDDSQSTRMEMSRLLQLLGFARVLEAKDGRAALAVLQSVENVDFLLTDLNMPVMDGVELLTQIEEHYSRRFCIAVISSVEPSLLSAVREIAEQSEFEMIGILPKPVNVDALYAALAKVDPGKLLPQAAPRKTLSFSAEDFRDAQLAGQIVPFFQPKIELASGRVVGMEALARWLHPTHGVIPPAAFIAYMDSGELAHPHFFQQVHAVLAMLHKTDAVMPGLSMSINLPVALLVVPNLVDDLHSTVLQHGLRPDRLVLEVTETSVMSNLKASLSTLARLRLKGFRISMDDYGTGYSSMQQLAKCPFTELKIDHSFVHNASQNRKLLSILTAAISICDQLMLVSVAEGCETEADVRQVTALGYKLAQGYFFSKPLSETDFLHYLEMTRTQ